MTANGIKFNGQNYDDWIEYVKLNAGLLGLDSALVMDELGGRQENVGELGEVK